MTPELRELADDVQASAIELADTCLAAMLAQGATALWIEPERDPQRHKDSEDHRISLERGHRTLSGATLSGGVGDAVVARLALLAGIDLLAPGPQSGRFELAGAGKRVEVVVTSRQTDAGLAAELRRQSGGGHSRGTGRLRLVRPQPETLSPGQQVGSYRVLRPIGRGGMGVVYEVDHSSLSKRFAMKVLRRDLLDTDPHSARRFLREARAAARIRHRGIVDVTDFGTLDDGRPFLVMELLGGRSLDAVLADAGALRPTRALALARGIADALAAAHACGVIHRDLTPGNIFVLDEAGAERVVLVDFGAALAPGSEAEIPDGPPGIVLGTPHYISPEQARGEDTDERSDIYALGVVLYELLTGEVPFAGDDVRGILRKHVYDPRPVPASPHEPLADAVKALVQRAMAIHPADRFASAAEAAADIRRAERAMARKGWRRLLPR